MQLRIEQVLQSIEGELLVAPASLDAEVLMLTWDSRVVKEQALYVALVGERVDGHAFVGGAIASGAACVVVSHALDEETYEAARAAGCAIIQVASGEDAIRALAGTWRSLLNATVIGITGSVGKTTTRSLTEHVLRQRYKTCATKGNFNNELGAPYTLLSADADCEMLVMEMGMSSLGEIADICSYAHPHMGLITNIGTSHMEYLKTRENVARAKGELLAALPENEGQAFLPVKEEFYDFLCEETHVVERGINVTPYGGDKAPGVFATDVRVDEDGHPVFTLHIGEETAECALNLRGLHNVDNACGAAAIGKACGLTMDEIIAGLHETMPESGRQEFKKAACGATVIDDTYNASPVSMKAALSMMASRQHEGRNIAILGDMGELGSETDHGHAEVGTFAAEKGIDLLVCVGPVSAVMAKAAREAGMNEAAIVHVDSVDNVLAVLPELYEGDTVLCKASHYMGLNAIVEGLID